MISAIFRVILIFIIITIVVAFLGSTGLGFSLGINQYTNLFLSLMKCVAYIIPIRKLLPILGVSIGVVCFKVSLSIIKTLWAVLVVRG